MSISKMRLWVIVACALSAGCLEHDNDGPKEEADDNDLYNICGDDGINGKMDEFLTAIASSSRVSKKRDSRAEIDPTAIAIAISIDSQQSYEGRYPWTQEDSLTLKMTATKLSLFDFSEQLNAGGVGMAYIGTVYHSEFYGVDQTFEAAEFRIKHDGDKYYWEGGYQSDVTKFGMTLYQSGFISNVEQNTTEYYCESALTTRIGTTKHDLDLSGGEFVFEDGDAFRYALQPY